MEQNFKFNELPVRTVTDENEATWFAGVDICTILEYANTTQAIEKLDEDEKKLDSVRQGPGQLRRTWMINEFGLYSLILTSTKPEAKAFKRWVTHEVLPAIRKAGKFTSEQEKEYSASIQAIVNDIEDLRGKKDDYQKKVNELKKAIETRTTEMISLVRMDRNQQRIEFLHEQ